MTRVVILEANTPEIIDARRARAISNAAECFEIAFRDLEIEIETQIVVPYREPFDAGVLDDFEAAIFTGSGVSWSVDAPEGRELAKACEAVFAHGMPVFGSCNGLQMASHLLGGNVQASPNGNEMGLARELKLTAQGNLHAMMAGRENGYCVPCIHRDEVGRLPDGAKLLAFNSHSPVQAFSYIGNGVDFWGVQYHPEMTVTNVAELLLDRRNPLEAKEDALIKELLAVETDEAIAERFGTRTEAQRVETRTLELQNWVAYLKALS
ncbi:MAG: type 1 glutamine amidotransferase [Pseudomonadota bacterium]